MLHTAVLPYDVETVRRDFPILNQMHHGSVPLVYLDSAASSQMPAQVIGAMDAYARQSHANVHRGIHKLSEAATEAYESARWAVRTFINAGSRREVIFTRGTTEAINLVAQTWGRQNLDAGDVVLSTVMEHHANIVPWQMLAAEKGFTIRYVPVTGRGLLDLDEFKRLLHSKNVKLVTLTHCSNVLGTINPIAQIARCAHAAGAVVLVDGAQAIPHMLVDVQALDADFYVFSGHKLLGPTGIGVLYGKRALLDAMPPWMGGGGMISEVTLKQSTWNELPYKFEAGTPPIMAAVGLGSAVDYLSAIGMDSVAEHARHITHDALVLLHEIPGVTTLGNVPERGSLVSFTVNGLHPHDVAQLLDNDGISVRAGHHCAMPLHDSLGIPATVRASFSVYTTLREIEALADGLRNAIKHYAR